MAKCKIDTFLMIIADQAGGKSNQLRSIFEEAEMFHQYGGYPTPNYIARRYSIDPDMDLYLRLASWHERGEIYTDVVSDIEGGYSDIRRRYKVVVPAQVTKTEKLVSGEDLFIKICNEFPIRRAFAVWLNPDVQGNQPFTISPKFAAFMASRRWVSALAIDSRAAHPSADPKKYSINSRLLADLVFRA